jgi:hypothetical protein
MFFKPKQVSGYKQETFDPKDVWEDELYSGEEAPLPEEYETTGFIFKEQGMYPFCVSMAIVAQLQSIYETINSRVRKFSQGHLFFNAGGNQEGSSVRDNLAVVTKDGVIEYDKMPLPEAINFPPSTWEIDLRKKAMSIPFADSYKIDGYARIEVTEDALKRAVLRYKAVIVPVCVDSSYRSGNAVRTKNNDNHIVLLKGWTKDKWKMFDSLIWKTNGEHTLDRKYTFLSAWVPLTGLQPNWRQEVYDNREKDFQPALAHYGKKRNFAKEVEVANELLKQLKKFNNKSVMDAAGRWWTVFVNAIAYGGYTYTDIINSTYNWRRTGKHLFEFDLETREQWYNRTIKGILNN